METITSVLVSEKYTGSNSAAILSMLPAGWAIAAEDNVALVLRQMVDDKGIQYRVEPGKWVVVEPGWGVIAVFSDEAYKVNYKDRQKVFLEAAADAAVVNQLGAVLAPQYENAVVTLPILLPNASATLIVPLSGTFPDTNYVVKTRLVSGANVLAMLSVTNIVKATNSVSVTVKATGVASVAGNLFVDCHRYYAASSIK